MMGSEEMREIGEEEDDFSPGKVVEKENTIRPLVGLKKKLFFLFKICQVDTKVGFLNPFENLEANYLNYPPIGPHDQH